MFSYEKAAQMAAYLLHRAGGKLRYIKVLKLMYLADREAMRLTGDSMTHDRFYAMKHGPVLSFTLNLMREEIDDPNWNYWIKRNDRFLKLQHHGQAKRGGLDELSVMDRKILDEVFAAHAHKPWKVLCNWTHDNCGEWRQPPGTSRLPIETKDVFAALGWDEDGAQEMAQKYAERRELDRVMSRYT